jgi:SH3-like domain-containing protein
MVATASAAIFNDLDPTAASTPAIEALAQARVVTANSDKDGSYAGAFRPNDQVTLAEMLKMALRGAKRPLAQGIPSNLSAQGTWASPYVNTAAQRRYSVFKSNKLDVFRAATRSEVVQTFVDAFGFRPQGIESSAAPITRGEAALLLSRFLVLAPTTPAASPSSVVSAPASSSASQASSASSIPVPPALSATHRVVASANMRSGAGMDYRVVRVLRPGEFVTLGSVTGAWSQVTLLDGTVGFVISTSITPATPQELTAPAPTSVPVAAPSASSVAPSAPSIGDGVITGPVNLRSQPAPDARAILSIPAGTLITILDQKSPYWTHVRLQDGREGYVSVKYVKAAQ